MTSAAASADSGGSLVLEQALLALKHQQPLLAAALLEERVQRLRGACTAA